MIQRVDDNIDVSRHSINNGVQVIANEVGTIRGYLSTLARDLAPVIKMAEDAKDLKSQAQGGLKAVYWIWPILAVLIAAGGIGTAAYIRYAP